MMNGTITISDVAEQLRQGSLTIPDVLWQCRRRRIADLNDKLNAVITLAPDVEAQAEEREAELRSGRDRGPLHGIPLLVKDNIDVAGLPSTGQVRKKMVGVCVRNEGRLLKMLASTSSCRERRPASCASDKRPLAEAGETKASAKAAPATGRRWAARASGWASRAR